MNLKSGGGVRHSRSARVRNFAGAAVFCATPSMLSV